MRTLFVTNTIPFPLTGGGQQRIYHLLRAVAGVSEVTFVCPTPRGEWCDELEALRPLFRRAVPFPLESFACHKPRGGRRWLSRLQNLVRHHGHPFEPALLRRYRSTEATQLVTSLRPDGYDLVWVERLIGMGLLPRNLRSGRVIIDLDDLLHWKLAHKLRHSGVSAHWPLDALELIKLRRLELGLHRLPWEFAVCSRLDRRRLGGHDRIIVVPNGVDMPASAPAPELGGRPVFLFVGMLGTEANADAARFMVTRVFPLIRRELPGARLLLVGANPGPQVRVFDDGTTVTVTGAVPSVTPYLRQATAAVVPIRIGSGTRIKILEAMAHRTPVVSTTVGAEGLDAAPGHHLLVADRPVDFAGACVRLACDPLLRHRLAAHAVELVRSRYSWPAIERQVQHVITSARPTRPQGVAP